ncbi:hypothetical protein BL250_09360 [Erwinia sp. OLTSP20]|uniref:DsbA family protein n=1 Tax=unclassified Erwinia TaxID=2622719 RepID=UPI000C1A6C79|nr:MULTISPECIES: DsbA family protein [unclassified Erwinia]PIJ50733.1 hypothetical protein BV501_07040 [Erwinia sp. OAMSP11]PIJ75402.1 hypothetical protein BK416_01835 [Erwinia sp. OLSSP12]PIJ81900.1 hypothetical protein BLD47_07385 [Erwinia sp. OLCASP19]PIJ84555.1 hypothetical protein BLD46_07475 [Erwinia sp. OLMTSP26]PIJ86902.1 hypothetical protein BLD49_07245 [Erwinia sp. OLMDSP33]
MTFKKISLTLCLLVFVCLPGTVSASSQPFSLLSKPVAEAPEVVEFFSFYCAPCFRFAGDYPVIDKINQSLPQGQKVAKYHISAMGKLGHELSEAWAVATVMGIADKVEKPLFIAVQRDHSLHSADDIKVIFQQAGVNPAQYDSARHSLLVHAFVARQQALADAFRVTSTPSVYVKGRYLINNAEIKADSPDQFVATFAALVNKLRKKEAG